MHFITQLFASFENNGVNFGINIQLLFVFCYCCDYRIRPGEKLMANHLFSLRLLRQILAVAAPVWGHRWLPQLR